MLVFGNIRVLTWKQTPEDRVALVRAIVEDSGKFFFGNQTVDATYVTHELTDRKGSDSAPHPIQSKKGEGRTAAGCFTQPWATALVVGALEEGIEQGWIKEEEVTYKAIENFLSVYGRAFYKTPRSAGSEKVKIRLERKGEIIPEVVKSQDGTIEVVPYGRGKKVWSTTWIE